MTRRAVAAWRTAIQQSPRDSLIHASLALGLLASGDQQAALNEMAAAQQLDPGWKRIAAVDFRWNQRMRADADGLAAKVTSQAGQAHSQPRRVPWPELV